ncbi:16S rRNA (adenine(1518)-N(6)/adenine(1519)-N(6))-dimethyltransferase [Campylobacter sp. MIT 99-7217]|uniref:16S rRNA (adenine(1518)-N(6)/adenine(1519)-N(6))- dimethyltransferase RsmA n=1 Tax=Campylobacter sp. MIT 99-7217 TaxID=535091 RepID=UPI001157466A|nr:16S rRNA (adenine(1518)-N(6)/adenine(1519)-N(6))-dimethyltransferase RsmA [Campylobacter sp. MIT 99-7217]TQR31379.1 16S rRNA (adenine(1518)-N(6)/adenine(1519)-N(6))-dimethyltransferase [Campylobacter sp. MIT 99-7217]
MIRAKKHFGQNFLKDRIVLEKIIQAISKDTKFIVEIGPGLGDLTQELLKISRVKAIEIDEDLIPFLRQKFKEQLASANLTLLNADASKLFEQGLDENQYFLVANLPYYVASNLILSALKDKKCLGLIVMVQKEVALKFCAKAGDSDFSALGVLSSLICEKEFLFEVPAHCFEPAPKVTSAVMMLKKECEFEEICDIKSFEKFLRASFKAPRKTLLSNLKAYKTELLELFKALNLKENIRPHELCAKSYLKLFQNLKDSL